MRPLVRYWHGWGLKAIVYLDDCIIAVEGESESLSEVPKSSMTYNALAL